MSTRVCDLAGCCTPGVFLFWLLQMGCSRVACHSRAPALTRSTNQYYNSVSHSNAQIHTRSTPFPKSLFQTQAWHHTLLESAVLDQIPRKISQGMFLFPFFNDSQEFFIFASGGTISSRHREVDGREGIFLAKIDQLVRAQLHTQMKTTSFQGSPLYGLLHGVA